MNDITFLEKFTFIPDGLKACERFKYIHNAKIIRKIVMTV